MTHQADKHAEPPGPLIAEHPDTISVKKLDDGGHHRFDNRDVEGGQKWRTETSYIPITRGEPVEYVCAAERRLHCFE